MNRIEELSYAKSNGIPISKNGKYSVDENLWGRSVEGSTIEDISSPLEDDVYEWVMPPEKCDDSGVDLNLGFKDGIPVSINNINYNLVEITEKLNQIAGSNGIGLINHIEDRVTGIKSHEVYECPAAILILKAHKMLESLTLNKNEMDIKNYLDYQWSNNVYNGLWYDPVMEHINAFESSANKYINGDISLKLYKGNITMTSISSDNSMYDYNTISYDNSLFDQNSGKGFIDIFKNNTVIGNSSRKEKLKVIQ